jgi:hypothetical protein
MRILPYIIISAIFPFVASVSSCENTEATAQTPVRHETTGDALDIIYAPDTNRWAQSYDSMPDNDCVRMKVHGVGGPLAKVFNDSNYLHYDVAKRLGIDPIDNDADAWNVKRPIVRIKSCPEYYVADLTHSIPYLIPSASDLLSEIGHRFNDTLKARGGGNYRLKITSLLRTNSSVKRLRRVNRCAVDSSAHRFGTTFDISYTRFMLDKKGGVNRTQEDLKNMLAEVIYAVRKEGKCYVKYERKSGCFHITTRQ